MNQATEKSVVPTVIPAREFSERKTFWGRLFRGTRRLQQRDDWKDLVGQDWPERIMALPVTDHFHAKQGRSTGRLVLQREGRRLAVFLKRHYRLPWWRGWLATLGPGRGWSPAWEELGRLEWARHHGFPVPATVAAAEFIGPWGGLQSILAIEELRDMLPLHEAIPRAGRLLAPGDFQRWKAGLIREIARLARELHRRRFFHKDLYLCHFFIPRADLKPSKCWQGRVHLIDLHRLAHHPLSWPLWLVKDLAQLLFSSEIPGVFARDRLRFWRCYLGPRRRNLFSRCLAWAIRLKHRRYQRHNGKRLSRSKKK